MAVRVVDARSPERRAMERELVARDAWLVDQRAGARMGRFPRLLRPLLGPFLLPKARREELLRRQWATEKGRRAEEQALRALETGLGSDPRPWYVLVRPVVVPQGSGGRRRGALLEIDLAVVGVVGAVLLEVKGWQGDRIVLDDEWSCVCWRGRTERRKSAFRQLRRVEEAVRQGLDHEGLWEIPLWGAVLMPQTERTVVERRTQTLEMPLFCGLRGLVECVLWVRGLPATARVDPQRLGNALLRLGRPASGRRSLACRERRGDVEQDRSMDR